MHKTHKMELIKGFLGTLENNTHCLYCVKCTCHDRNDLLSRPCPLNPEVLAKRAAKNAAKDD